LHHLVFKDFDIQKDRLKAIKNKMLIDPCVLFSQRYDDLKSHSNQKLKDALGNLEEMSLNFTANLETDRSQAV